MMNHQNNRWNLFLDLAGNTFEETGLSEVQYTAWQCLYYLNYLYMGGHREYLDTVPHKPENVVAALTAVGGKHFADNFLRAVREGRTDGFAAADAAFNAFTPSLEDCLKAYVEAHQEEIFKDCWEDA